MITSIPQDVFISSGAVVKPSIVVLKRFTEEEENNWKTITKDANNEIHAMYKKKLTEIKEKLKLRRCEAEKKALRKEFKNLKAQIETEIQAIIKERFNYTIPVAENSKAGIDSKGVRIYNELPTLKDEYTQYRKQTKLWEKDLTWTIYYKVKDSNIIRVANDKNLNEKVFYAEEFNHRI